MLVVIGPMEDDQSLMIIHQLAANATGHIIKSTPSKDQNSNL